MIELPSSLILLQFVRPPKSPERKVLLVIAECQAKLCRVPGGVPEPTRFLLGGLGFFPFRLFRASRDDQFLIRRFKSLLRPLQVGIEVDEGS